MATHYLIQVDYFLRLIVAGICGALIGYERKNRMKEAGIRTHFIVALGASLMMIVSKYGFQDQSGWHNVSLDPSRIAAQVVSGVGFLGAGMIFMQRQTVKGLTTAAGIWATAGMGMAIGAGLYSVGLAVALIIVVAQTILHVRFNWLSTPKTEQLILQIIDKPGAMEHIQRVLEEKNIEILSFRAEKNKEYHSTIDLEIVMKIPKSYQTAQLFSLIQDIPFVKSIEL